MFLIYTSTTWLSVQNFSATFPRFSSFLTKQTIFADNNNAANSSLGIDKNFFGVTLDLPTNKLKCISPSLFTMVCNCTGHTPFLRLPRNDKGWFLLSFQTCEAWYISVCVDLQHTLIYVPIFPKLLWALDLQHHLIAHSCCTRFEAITFPPTQMGLEILKGCRLN